MTNREAMELVLEAAEKRAEYHPQRDEILEAVDVMKDYMNDLMREEQPTGCDYGIGG